MSLMTPDPANPERDGASVVHIDVNRAPFRQKTVIAYLTEVPEKGGGATVFPCIVPGGGEKLVRKRRAMCEAMATNHLASASEDDDPFGLWAAAVSPLLPSDSDAMHSSLSAPQPWRTGRMHRVQV